MATSRRVHCPACQQTFLSSAETTCPLCGAHGLQEAALATGSSTANVRGRQFDSPNPRVETALTTDQTGRGRPAVLVAAVFLVALALAALWYFFKSERDPRSDYSTITFSGAVEEKVTAKNLSEAFLNDGNKAKYQGKGVQVTGKVQLLDPMARNGSLEMLLDSENDAFVVAEVPPSFRSQFEKVGLDDVISVKGLCRGSTRGKSGGLYVWILGCQLVDIVKKKPNS